MKALFSAGLVVGLLIALIWMHTFHGDQAWVRIAWKGLWLVVLPVLTLIGATMISRSRNSARRDDD